MSMARAVMGLLCLLACAAAPAQPASLRQVALRDQQAQAMSADALRGHVVLLHFVFTGCSATCPTQVRELAWVLDALPPSAREAVRFVSVSLDPHDTPATLAAFARQHGADRAGWQFASGRPADIDRLAARLLAFDPSKAGPALGDHRTSLFVYDRRGDLVQRYAGVPVDGPRLQRELTQLALHPPTSARQP